MAIDYEKLKARRFDPIEQSYSIRDSILYALGVGLGQDPLDAQQLRFVYEHNLAALPTMAVVLAYPGFWLKEPDTGVDWKRVLHGEQWLTLHAPLPASTTVTGSTRVMEIVDKGPGKGAVMYSIRHVVNSANGELLATLTQSAVLRGDGGFGGPREWAEAPKPQPIPESAPDDRIILSSRPESALIYRLCGDYNPLHADPAVASAAGFTRPILHGLALYGMAGHAVLKARCDYDPARLERLDCRFSSPVYPGESITTEIWNLGRHRFAFRCSVAERNVVVLNNGYAEVKQ
jgi:acyl dehydratase